LKENPQRKARVEGFTDSVGSDSHNQELSARRADAVRNALVEMGVTMDRIASQGYGEAHPVAGNDSASGRQLNRRVEIVLSDEAGKLVPR
jgi:outer membrane protein OmpA-like peptidoglycan-associated protein